MQRLHDKLQIKAQGEEQTENSNPQVEQNENLHTKPITPQANDEAEAAYALLGLFAS